jgi:Ca2+-binding RTX toxin-like protein
MAINGTNGDDQFRGTIFGDEIFGFRGDDEFGGSPGADTLDGGDDNDTVQYGTFKLNGSSTLNPDGTSVNVDLERAMQFGGLAEGDVLIDIENVSGSGEDDIIKGDGEDNQLLGNGGDDILDGRGGNDFIVRMAASRSCTVIRMATITSTAAPAMTFCSETAATIL